jgi:hypothetical protein
MRRLLYHGSVKGDRRAGRTACISQLSRPRGRRDNCGAAFFRTSIVAEKASGPAGSPVGGPNSPANILVTPVRSVRTGAERKHLRGSRGGRDRRPNSAPRLRIARLPREPRRRKKVRDPREGVTLASGVQKTLINTPVRLRCAVSKYQKAQCGAFAGCQGLRKYPPTGPKSAPRERTCHV